MRIAFVFVWYVEFNTSSNFYINLKGKKFISFFVAFKVRTWTFVLYYIFLLYAAMGVGVCGAINFFGRSYTSSRVVSYSWVAYAIVVLGAIANVICIVYFFMLACASCSRKIIPLPPSKIPALPLPPGAQPLYSMGINPNAAMMNNQFGGGFANANAYQYPNMLSTPNAFQYQNPQPISSFASNNVNSFSSYSYA